MTAPTPQEAFGQLREFLHTSSPGERTRSQLYALLREAFVRDADVYAAEWVPYLKDFESWWARPLVWSTLQYLGNSAWYPSARACKSRDALSTYRRIVPFGPWQLEVLDMSRSHLRSPAAAFALDDAFSEEQQALCRGLRLSSCYLYDDGTSQEYYEWPAREDDLITILAAGLEKLPGIDTLELELNRSGSSYSMQGSSRRVRVYFGEPEIRQAMALLEERELAHLTLTHDYPLTQLARWKELPCWEQLETLDLSGNKLGAGAPRKLFCSPMPRLTCLKLERNEKFGDKGAQALARSKNLPALTVLHLQGAQVSEQARAELLSSPNLPSLTHVYTGS